MPGPFSELHADGAKVAELAPRLEGAPDPLFLEFATLAACPPGRLYFLDATLQGRPGARARRGKKTPPVAMTAQRHGGLLLHRPFAEAWLADVPAAQATLRPVQVRDQEGVVSDDYALVDVHALYPLDRAGPGFEPFDPARPHGSHVAKLGEPRWGEGRTPPVRLFRLLELPTAVFVDAELLAALEKATKGAVGALAGRRRDGQGLQPPPWAKAMLPPFGPDEAVSVRAADAFWALTRGERSAALRAAALESPLLAVAVALAVDGGPADDTRAAAARAPDCAVPYAVLVDRGPHPLTEAAARKHGVAAAGYAGRVTARIDDEVAALMVAQGGHDAASVATARSRLEGLRPWLEQARRRVGSGPG